MYGVAAYYQNKIENDGGVKDTDREDLGALFGLGFHHMGRGLLKHQYQADAKSNASG